LLEQIVPNWEFKLNISNQIIKTPFMWGFLFAIFFLYYIKNILWTLQLTKKIIRWLQPRMVS
jgi:hypothetical protein